MNKKNILIIPRTHIGDFIWSTSAINIIRKHNPEAHITVVAPKYLSEFIIGNYLFDNVYWYNAKLFEYPNKLIRIIYKAFLFVKFILHFKIVKTDECFLFSPEEFLIKAISHINAKKFIFASKECCGYNRKSKESEILNGKIKKNRLYEIETPIDADNTHCTEIYQTVVRGYLNVTDISLHTTPQLKNKEKINLITNLVKTNKEKRIALCLRASVRSGNKYPSDYFNKIVSEISKNISAAFFIIGGKEQSEYARRLIKSLDKNIEISDLSGKTSLLELKELFKHMDLLLSIDTGVPHIASMTGVKMITIFGAAKPNAVAPMSPNNISFYAETECSPCIYNIAYNKMKCKYPDSPECMKNIKPEEIIKLALKILENKK